ncbi:dTDP-glucose 4,6-dehydratase [Candidatus Micrarchaeota archaeon]|nr:dTDP-glucose 4,6-dehydratase [Candidatus Micrarchaeota archaeon]
MHSKILVTGGLGFIGSHFIRRTLQRSDARIVNLDLDTYAGNPANLQDVQADERYAYVHGDIADPQTVQKAIRGCDAVVHFAAESHVDNSIRSADAFIHTNIVGTQNLIKCAQQQNVAKFIQVSTDEVYGSIEHGAFTEKDKLTPSSPYSASKAAAEMLCMAYGTTFGLPVCITRSTNNFGPYQHPEKLIPKAILHALAGKAIPVYGNGTNVRDWVYVEDNADAIGLVLEKGKPGQTYNIAGRNERTNLDVVQHILDAVGNPQARIEHVQDRKGHDFRYAVDDAKIRALGFRTSQAPFSERILQTVQWYRDNPNWCATCKNSS